MKVRAQIGKVLNLELLAEEFGQIGRLLELESPSALAEA